MILHVIKKIMIIFLHHKNLILYYMYTGTLLCTEGFADDKPYEFGNRLLIAATFISWNAENN